MCSEFVEDGVSCGGKQTSIPICHVPMTYRSMGTALGLGLRKHFGSY